MDKRALGVEYFVKALSTGERTAAQRLEPFLAEDVEYDTNTQPGAVPIGREVFKGRADVLNQVFGLWPATPGYARLGWSEPEADGDKLKVATSGAVTLEFGFNDRDEISRVRLDGGYGSGLQAPPVKSGPVETIPLAVKGLINNALANQTPVVVTYVDESGQPHSSLRGSVTVFSPTQLSIWVRHADGGLPRAVVKNDRVSLLYNDRRAGATVIFEGRASIKEDEESRRKAYELCPEVEQTHDPHRHGVALVIDVTRMQANLGAGRGSFTLTRPA
ncbi:MAG TPA: pyridoxamine 5'-phosphate oxidase family protein [Dehalococcoidia bacterium]|nr:pyridoxamine 5'-phosphate oxidase family protein [Dehalococcoidia bacterium]